MTALIATAAAVLCALASIGFTIAAHHQARKAEAAADAANDYAVDAERAADRAQGRQSPARHRSQP